jgi:uncharacterized beta-barrel protein YwiB (DUF1934 family)
MKVTPKKNIYRNIKGKKKIKIFTKGKFYENLSTDKFNDYLHYYELINDLGSKELIFETSLFQTISEKRNKILNDLLN